MTILTAPSTVIDLDLVDDPADDVEEIRASVPHRYRLNPGTGEARKRFSRVLESEQHEENRVVLMVEECDQSYCIPQSSVESLVWPHGDNGERDVEHMAGSMVMRFRGSLLPLVPLAQVFGQSVPSIDAMTVVVINHQGYRFGLCVSKVRDTREVAASALGSHLAEIPLYSAASVTDEGDVALVLDMEGIALAQRIQRTEPSTEEGACVVAPVEVCPLLVLEVGDGQRVAVPLGAVSRLEKFEKASIEHTGAHEVIQYRGSILPLIRLASAVGVPEASATGDETLRVVVHESDTVSVGLVVSRIHDVVETEIVGSLVEVRPGIRSTVVIRGLVTDVIDLDAVIVLAGLATTGVAA